ncbi:MAG: LL-diaminopimelate aminotransferase [Thermosulfidibacteraceae bacterium]
MAFEWAERLKKLPPYLFAAIDEAKKRKVAEGCDVIDLGVGDPDMPTPRAIVEAMKRALENPAYHRYPSYEGMLRFRQAVADWYKRRFNVELDPTSEVTSLIGSKEGIAHLPFAFVNPGDYVIVPDPGYPVYHGSTVLAGGIPYHVPLKMENSFLPDLESIPEEVLKKTRIFFVNYPNNPTSSLANREFFEGLIKLAKDYGFIVAHDAAYSEIYYENPPISVLEIDGAKDVAVEFHSLSKTFNMTGWRIGMAVGNPDVIRGLIKVKTNIDSGVFEAIQEAAIYALENEPETDEIRLRYKRRRDVFIEVLKKNGFDVKPPKATFYIWTPVPEGYDSISFAKRVLEEANVVITPGVGFGKFGEGYFRMTLCISEERLEEAANRIAKVL